MRKFLEKFASAYNKVVHSNTFLKVVSVLIGITIWLAVINVVNPLKSDEYTKVPVKVEMGGSVAEYYGLSFRDGIPSLTVTVEVEGTRSGLMNFSKEKLNASFDLSKVTEARGYELDIIVTSSDEDVWVTSVSPSSFTCYFDTTETKTFPVQVNTVGVLPEGYFIKEQVVSPSSIEVTGPSSVLSAISFVSISPNINGATTSISSSAEVMLKAPNGSNIGKGALTLSTNEVLYNYDIVYRTSIPVAFKLMNLYGGDESSYMSVQYSHDRIVVEGEKSVLDKISAFDLGYVYTHTLTNAVTTFTRPVPQSADYSIVYEEQQDVVVTVSYDANTNVSTKTFTFANYEMDGFSVINCPEGYVPVVTEDEMSFTVRGLASQLTYLNKADITCVIDCSQTNADGDARVVINFPGNIKYGLMNNVFISLDYEEAVS